MKTENKKYKDSGIPWIGEIPEGWEVKKVKNITTEISKGNGITKEEVFADGDTPCVRYGEIYSKYDNSFVNCFSKTKKDVLSTLHYFGKGDILCAGTGELVEEIGKSIVYLGENQCLAGGDIVVLRHCQNPLFLNFALNSKYAQAQKSCSKAKLKVVHISAFDIGNILIAIPSLPTQQRIADFLDRKCAEIDELSALQETMIAELKRYKQSVITEAVTKGLDPDVPMKDSGVEWIGEIPEGWEIGRIKNVASLYGRIGFRGYTSDDLNKDGIGAITLSPSNMLPMSMDYSSVTYLSWKKYEESPEIMIQNGDLLMVKTGSSYGKVSYVSALPREATINPQILRIVPKIHSKYLAFYLQTSFFSFQVEGGVVGGTIPTISQEKINNFRVILPPLAEQQAIADYLDEKSSEIDELIAIKQQKIEQLKEYKKSVIFEYVTGKKEI